MGNLTKLEERFNELNRRFSAFEAKMDERFLTFESEVDKEFSTFKSEVNERFDAVGGKLSSFAESVKSTIAAMHETFADLIALKGLITPDESNFLAREVGRLSLAIKVNPITAEELRFIREVTAKDVDKITIEEMERIANIAKRWWYEEGKGEAYKMFFAATLVKAQKI